LEYLEMKIAGWGRLHPAGQAGWEREDEDEKRWGRGSDRKSRALFCRYKFRQPIPSFPELFVKSPSLLPMEENFIHCLGASDLASSQLYQTLRLPEWNDEK
jgi:hypothetical protein